MNSHLDSQQKIIKVEEAPLLRVQDPHAQILYFACMPNAVGERDELFLRRGKSGTLEI